MKILNNIPIESDKIIDKYTPWEINHGILDYLFVIPFAKLMLYLADFVGMTTAIIIVTIIANLIILPTSILRSLENQKKAKYSDEVRSIKSKYSNKKDKKNKKLMKKEIKTLYKNKGIKTYYNKFSYINIFIMVSMWQAVQRIPDVYEASFFGFNLGYTPLQMLELKEYNYVAIVFVVVGFELVSLFIKQILSKFTKRNNVPKYHKIFIYTYILLTVLLFNMLLKLPTAMNFYLIVNYLVKIISSSYLYLKYNLF